MLFFPRFIFVKFIAFGFVLFLLFLRCSCFFGVFVVAVLSVFGAVAAVVAHHVLAFYCAERELDSARSHRYPPLAHNRSKNPNLVKNGNKNRRMKRNAVTLIKKQQ